MKITKKTLCATRSIIYIAKELEKDSKKLVAIREIAKCQQVSVSYLEQVLNKLKKAKMIVAKRGPNGGYTLHKSPDKITIYDIVNLFEKNYKIIDCENPGDLCTGFCTSAKPVWDDLNNAIDSFLKGKSIQDYL